MTNAAWLADVLRLTVPSFYIASLIYLAALGGGHARKKHLLVFAAAGVSGYMVLNQPAWEWVPSWITTDHWLIVALVAILVLGLLLFADAIESSSDLKWPWERVGDLWRWVKRQVTRITT
ncbi:hypothetical protein [Halalkalicoccus sp. NIPERK01]|uniref:hypothetical protein n=1 Tax=Halalkalicoccus sp. NIPERK01 TaxID=3053469 RepID=UPI00256EF1B3|nr:hypothetical protein [Halalkalicoccus sp. NIPERK01]MDL5361336.1 hypothetical protein [Halalkalicoccus sp. NIPERK01]